MKSFYYVRNDETEFKNLIVSLKQKFQKIAIYQALACDNSQCRLDGYANELGVKTHYTFNSNDGFSMYLKEKNIFYKSIIKDFLRLQEENDFVIISSFNNFGTLSAFMCNMELSKELNQAVVLGKNDNLDELIQVANSVGIKAISSDNLDKILGLDEPKFMTPMAFECFLESKAKQDIKTIVLPEGNDERILKAADLLLKGGAVKLIILGNNQEIIQKANELGLDLDDVKTINPGNSQYDEEFATALYEARKAKGMSEEQAKELIKDRNYFGTLLVHLGYADAMVSGAACSTADTIRPALQLIKTKKDVKSVSGGFFMCLSDKVWYFADCAVTPNPTPEQNAECAYVSANTFKAFGFEPKVAMLSYSTANSGSGISVDATKQACEFAKNYVGLNFDGPIQFDAAVDIKTASKKMPDSKVAGHANVFVFPDLNAANICYKAVQRTANAVAVGPLLQGLNKPINDLSRGCLVEDIVNTCLISAIQAQ